ncbi:MAG: cytochrome c, mono- and diheme variant family [Acidobacteriaceae bacterium]|nr:cytochrome c, mono- and diheme variant family [Acidobacteriaceae bacterium]
MRGAETKTMMQRVNQIALLGALSGVSLLAGCRQDMHDQPKFYPQRGTAFYVDGRSVRPQVANTVGRNQLHDDSYFYTGLIAGKEGEGLPFPVTLQVLAKGQERYNVYCTPCHSRVGNGAGMIVQRGYSPAGNFQGGRLRAVGLGHFFNVMTNGYGSMPDYAAQLTPADRWAVAAYIRALQLSQSAQRSDVPSGVDVKPIKSIAASEGLPESFGDDWDVATPAEMPGAAVPSSAPATSSAPAPAATTPAPAAGTTSSVTPVPVKPEKKEITVAEVKAGLAIYEKNCQVCHTAQLTGHPPTFPSLVGVVQRLGAEHVKNNVIHGAPPMPAFPQISTTELEQLVAFLTVPSKAGVATAPSTPRN